VSELEIYGIEDDELNEWTVIDALACLGMRLVAGSEASEEYLSELSAASTKEGAVKLEKMFERTDGN
jgi:hypothetical protein